MNARKRIPDNELHFIEDNLALIQDGMKALQRATVARNLTEMGPHLIAVSTALARLYARHTERHPSRVLPPLEQEPGVNEVLQTGLDRMQMSIDDLWHEVRSLRAALVQEANSD